MLYGNTLDFVQQDCNALNISLGLKPGDVFTFETSKWYNIKKFQFAFNIDNSVFSKQQLL